MTDDDANRPTCATYCANCGLAPCIDTDRWHVPGTVEPCTMYSRPETRYEASLSMRVALHDLYPALSVEQCIEILQVTSYTAAA